MRSAHVVAIKIHPESGRPGVELSDVEVEAEGLAGDRRKKAAVHLVGADEAATRANIVLDTPTAELADLVGREVSIGGARLGIARTAGNCAGVYADVLAPGVLRVGDTVALD